MGTEILKSYTALQSELEQAKSSLKGVDESIKRLIGRDPSEFPTRPPLKRGVSNDDRSRPARLRNFQQEEEPPSKRRTGVSVFKRLSDRPVHYKDEFPNKQMISKVIVTPKEVPSRQEALAAQSKDEKFKERNRRMFGALLGTLQKFQQEETKLKQREDKRAQVEKKIEEHEIKEKEEIKKERQNLFLDRKKKQAEIKMIELKMLRMKEYATWEDRQKPRMHFIKTNCKPQIYYLPRRMNEPSKKLLESCKIEMQKTIDAKKKEVCDELQRIEERMKRKFEEKIFRKEEGGKRGEREEEDEDSDEDDDDHETNRNQHSNDQENNQETKADEENSESINDNPIDKIAMPEDNKEKQENTGENKDKTEQSSENGQAQQSDEKSATEAESQESKKTEKENAEESEKNTNTAISQPRLAKWNDSAIASQMSWGEIAWQSEDAADNTSYSTNVTENNESTSQSEMNNEQVENSSSV